MRDTSSAEGDAHAGAVGDEEVFEFVVADEGSGGAVDVDGQVLENGFELGFRFGWSSRRKRDGI